tara:strand:- start:2629 stop:3912 length:1284 start_codon:yes stop_codon:yes gene_type:complete
MPNRNQISDNLYLGSLKKKSVPTNVAARQLQSLLDPAIVNRAMVAPWGRDKQGVGQWAVPGIVAGAMKALDQTGEAMQLPPGTSPDHPAYKGVFDVAGAINLPSLLRKGATSTVGMNLWHGGPNKWAAEPGFPQGRPRLDKIGEGEGNTAFGEGFYSAQNPYVAKDYQIRLSPRQAEMTYNKKPVSAGADRSSSTRRGTDVTPQEGLANEIFMLARTEGVDPSVILRREIDKVAEQKFIVLKRAEAEKMSDSRRIPLGQSYDDHLALLYSIDPKLIKKIDPKDMKETGHLYKIDIPDEDIAKYIDLDAPLSEQKEIIEKLKTVVNNPNDPNNPYTYEIIKQIDEVLKNPNATGEKILEILGNDKIASEFLTKLGIPGNRYADQMSRGKNAQTRNYVTWDQKVLDRAKVLQRNEEIYKQLEKSGVPFA